MYVCSCLEWYYTYMNGGQLDKQNSADRVRAMCHTTIERAKYEGRDVVTISAGDVVRELSMQYRVPTVCSVLASKKFQKENGVTLESQEGPKSGISTKSRYTYRIHQDVITPVGRSSSLMALRGAGKEVYLALGGGETHLKAERAEFERA